MKSKGYQEKDHYDITETHFRFTTHRQGCERSNHEVKWHSVPFLGDFNCDDIALYSTITGKNNSDIPLKIAQALVDSRFDWNFSLSQIREIGRPIPSIPKSLFHFHEIHVDEQRKLIWCGSSGDVSIELGSNWRPRGEPICSAVQESTDDAIWPRPSLRADLVQYGDKFIWLTMGPPSKEAALCPGLVELKNFSEDIAECLKLWQPNLGKPTDSADRLQCWIESKTCARGMDRPYC